MRLTELFTYLTSGELSQLELGGADCSGIHVENYPKVIPAINLGLTELHKRFPLRIEEVTIVQEEHIQFYVLDRIFAESNIDSTETYKYLKDSEFQPFVDNVLKIEQVFGELGDELPMNNHGDCCSVFTPVYNTVQVPQPVTGVSMVVTYRADHDMIPLTDFDPEEQTIVIPSGYLEALLLYVGGRIYAGMNADANAEGNNYMAKFEASCNKITSLNLMNQADHFNCKLELCGWP